MLIAGSTIDEAQWDLQLLEQELNWITKYKLLIMWRLIKNM